MQIRRKDTEEPIPYHGTGWRYSMIFSVIRRSAAKATSKRHLSACSPRALRECYGTKLWRASRIESTGNTATTCTLPYMCGWSRAFSLLGNWHVKHNSVHVAPWRELKVTTHDPACTGSLSTHRLIFSMFLCRVSVTKHYYACLHIISRILFYVTGTCVPVQV